MTTTLPTVPKQTTQPYILAANEGKAIWFLNGLVTIKAASDSTRGVLSFSEFLHPLKTETPLHVHHGEDEAFYILEGAMRGVVGDKPFYATAGSFVWLPHDIPHRYAAEGDQHLRTLVITVPSGFDQFIEEMGEPAQERTLPQESAVDIEKLITVSTKHGIDTLQP